MPRRRNLHIGSQVSITDQSLPIPAEPLPFEERAEALLSRVFGGMHHVHSLKKQPAPNAYWTCIHSGDLATYDCDHLTMLILGAHEYMLRVSITNGGPRALKIWVFPRHGRDGCTMSRRHPDIQTAIATWGKL